MKHTMKKAQGGKKVSLRTGQLKRLGKLSAKNPDKAASVSEKMVERATRRQRGMEYLKKNVEKLTPEVPALRKGNKVKKARNGATLAPTASNVSKRLGSSKKLKNGGTLAPSKSSTSRRLASAHTRVAKSGAKMAKCKYGCK